MGRAARAQRGGHQGAAAAARRRVCHGTQAAQRWRAHREGWLAPIACTTQRNTYVLGHLPRVHHCTFDAHAMRHRTPYTALDTLYPLDFTDRRICLVSASRSRLRMQI